MDFDDLPAPATADVSAYNMEQGSATRVTIVFRRSTMQTATRIYTGLVEKILVRPIHHSIMCGGNSHVLVRVLKTKYT